MACIEEVSIIQWIESLYRENVVPKQEVGLATISALATDKNIIKI